MPDPGPVSSASWPQPGGGSGSRAGAPSAEELFWDRAHVLISGLPALRRDLAEPVLGGPAGDRHTITIQLGYGSFGTVYMAEETGTGRHAALKVIAKREMSTRAAVKQLAAEIGILARLSHPSVVQLLGVVHTAEHVSLLLEYCGPVNLFQALQGATSSRFAPERARQLFAQIAAAIAHCHEHGIAHRDVKPENTMLSADGLTAKVVDFGTARALPAACDCQGTVPFTAPEVMAMKADRYDAAKADVWSLGVVLLEMVCGLNCLPDMLGWRMPRAAEPALAAQLECFMGEQVIAFMLELRSLHLPVSRDLARLLHGMLRLSVNKRWAASSVLDSPWLASQPHPEIEPV